jgi:hypothetical protein
MIAVVTTKLGPSRRYKCTCGHSEDLREDHPVYAKSDEALELEGFQEIME